MPSRGSLPDHIRGFFWDCDPAGVCLDEHRSFVIRRVLEAGDWDAVTWLRKAVGDDGIREWLARKRGGGLSARKLRLWQIILGLADDEVAEWIVLSRGYAWQRGQSA